MYIPPSVNELTEQIIGIGIKVHRRIGPGLLESVYSQCLCWEFERANLEYRRQVALPVIYEGVQMPQGYFADIIVANTVLLELKAVDHILPVHKVQTRTYLRLSGCRVALLINFNTVLLKDGLHRFIP